MLELPKNTEIAQQLPKKIIFSKFGVKSSQRDRFDADISKITLVNVISQATVPALQQGETMTTIYVLDVVLKKPDYDSKNITLLSNLIPQKILFILRYEGKVQLAIYHTKLICSKWMTEESAYLTISGTTLDAVWDNWVRHIGNIEVEENNTLTEQIAINEERAKLLRQIDTLDTKARAEKQPRKKYKMFQKLQDLKSSIKQMEIILIFISLLTYL